MQEEPIAEALLGELTARLADLDRIDAMIAAAHLDAAIEALCRQFKLFRYDSTMEIVN